MRETTKMVPILAILPESSFFKESLQTSLRLSSACFQQPEQLSVLGPGINEASTGTLFLGIVTG